MKRSRFSGKGAGWGLFVLLLAMTSPVAAGNGDDYELESLTVTAHKREESTLEVPGNVTAVEGFTMKDFGVDRIDSLSRLVPNIDIAKIDTHMTQVVFRGIGGLTNMNKVWNTNVDGVSIPYVGVDMFLDVERIELLKGSQGALYGRNTHAGVVNVITRKPGTEFDFDTSLEFERFNTTRFKTAFGGPVGGNRGYRFAFGATKGDGYTKNTFRDSEDGGHHSQYSGRFIYTWTPDPESRFLLSLTGDTYDGGFDLFSPLESGRGVETTNNLEGSNEGSLLSPTLTWERELFSGILTTITNVSFSEYAFLLDQDFTERDLMAVDFDESFQTFTQEIRFVHEGRRLDWLGGAFFLMEGNECDTDFGLGNDYIGAAGVHQFADGEIRSKGVALFGHLDYRPSGRWKVGTGLRLDYEKRDFDWRGHSESGGVATGPVQTFGRDDDWFGVMPSIDLTYLPTETQRIYASVARGYRVGDYAANQIDVDAVREAVDPEYTLTFEVGYKGRFMENRLELSTAIFHIDYDDMQVSTMKGNVALMQNAAEAHSDGAELEARFQASRNMDFLFTLGVLEGEFDRFENHPSGRVLEGNRLPNANEYSASLAARYRNRHGLFASCSTAFMGPKYMDELNTERQESHTVVNARIGYEAEHWSVTLYGRNLLDETYLLHTFAGAGRVGEPTVVGIGFNGYF